VTALPTETLHASCVALGANAVLILGPSGSGKSALALQLMAFGCRLVSDDRTVLTCRDGALFASAPAAIRGRIEARGIGILAAETTPSAHVALATDMGVAGSDRLPLERHLTLLGCPVPLVHKVESTHFPAAVLQYLKGGRSA
jgi:HPr kinase/phosphorylase